MIVCKSPAELERMKAANQLVAEVLAALREAVRPGVTTGDLDALAESQIRAGGGEPAFKGYHGFPATICASVNEEVIHGIPSQRELVEGDVISIDLGAVLDGFYGDSAITVPVGRVSERAAELLRVTEESLHRAIAQVKVGARISDLGHAVQQFVVGGAVRHGQFQREQRNGDRDDGVGEEREPFRRHRLRDRRRVLITHGATHYWAACGRETSRKFSTTSTMSCSSPSNSISFW